MALLRTILLGSLVGCAGWRYDTGQPDPTANQPTYTDPHCTEDAQCQEHFVCYKDDGSYVGVCAEVK